jgi:hypothetical protein
MSPFLRIAFSSLICLNLILSPLKSTGDYDPLIAEILNEGSQDRWVSWIAALSGAVPISTDLGEAVIQTRSSYVMFEPDQTPSAFQYVQDELQALGFKEGEDFLIHTYAYPYGERYPERNWKNLILTFPGEGPSLKDERVLLVAHLDSTSEQELELAPGADDNASGAAGLLEAAARLGHYSFDRTIHLVWFSGEEQSRYGSKYFVRDFEDWLPDIVGVINLDMFAFDSDNDRCFEVHAGALPGSQQIGLDMAAMIDLYDLDLRFDFIDDETAYTLADQYPFWEAGVPAVMVFENFFYQEGETCGNVDRNARYHSVADMLSYINQDTGYAILQAAIATLAHIAGPVQACFATQLQAFSYSEFETVTLNWSALEGASSYQIWIDEGRGWHMLDEIGGLRWAHSTSDEERDADYMVIAVSDSRCQSIPAITQPRKVYCHFE